MKVNQKAIIFVSNSTTLDVLYKLFLQDGYNTIKYKDNNSLERFRADADIQILIATDDAAKGLDIEYCPVVVNYDMIFIIQFKWSRGFAGATDKDRILMCWL